MSEIVRKIYEQVVSEEKCAQEGRKRTDAYVEDLIRRYAADHGQEEAECSFRPLVYAAALKAEQEGFQLGIQFAIRLLLELYPCL